MTRNDIVNYSVQDRLRDGRTMTIRAMRPDDAGLVAEGLRRVSPESLYRRTFSARRTFTDKEIARMVNIDFERIVSLVAVRQEEGKDRIVGGGRYVRTGDAAGKSAEVAFLIDDTYQGMGIGSRVFKHLLIIARASGITRFEAEVLPANEAMMRVFTRSGVPVTTTRTRDSVYVLMELVKEEV